MTQLGMFDSDDLSAIVVAGIDEAGRGPLAGSVFAAAVILDPNQVIEGLTDSKKLSEKKRDLLAPQIKARALAWNIASASVQEIDTLNILQATMLAMKRAYEGLSIKAGLILIDGNKVPLGLSSPAKAIVKGDLTEPCISAASILAKTARDSEMLHYHEIYPQYAFDAHKGYGTALHVERLNQYGPCDIHRRSFAPVKKLLA